MGKWIILLGRAKLKPDTPKAGPGPQFRPGNVGIIVPNLSAVPGRLIRKQDAQQQDCEEQYMVATRLTRAGRRF
jgi:hypothetical protein